MKKKKNNIVMAHCAGGADQSPEQPLLVTTDSHSLIRTRRSLYEALLQLERQDAVVVERALHHVDVALSPSTCLCIWTEQALLQESNLTASHCCTSSFALLHEKKKIMLGLHQSVF